MSSRAKQMEREEEEDKIKGGLTTSRSDEDSSMHRTSVQNKTEANSDRTQNGVQM